MNPHEVGFINSFVKKDKRERTATLISNPRRRRKFLESLAHFGDLDPRYARAVSSSEAHTAEQWARLLTAKGAPANCWVISENISRDGREYPLLEALQHAMGSGMGNVISCISGQLCYFEDEDQQLLLER